MVGKTIGRAIDEGQLPVYIERFGSSRDEIFVTASALRHELGDTVFDTLPAGALGLYTYYERLAQGLRQLMAGSRKFSMDYINRDDLAALDQGVRGGQRNSTHHGSGTAPRWNASSTASEAEFRFSDQGRQRRMMLLPRNAERLFGVSCCPATRKSRTTTVFTFSFREQ